MSRTIDHHQERRDVADAAAEEGQVVLVAAHQRLGEADDQAADQRARGGVQAAEDRGGERLDRGERGAAVQPGVGNTRQEQRGDGGQRARHRPGAQRDPAAAGCPSARRSRGPRRPPASPRPRRCSGTPAGTRRSGRRGHERGDPGLRDADGPRCTTWSPQGSPRASTSVPIRRVSSVISTMSTPMVTIASTLWRGPGRAADDQELDQRAQRGRAGDPGRAAPARTRCASCSSAVMYRRPAAARRGRS